MYLILNQDEKIISFTAILNYLIFLSFYYFWVGTPFIGDAKVYLNESIDISKAVYNQFHVPLYPLSVGILSRMFFGVVPNELIMLFINFFSYLFGALLVYKTLKIKSSKKIAFYSSISFLLWPLVGASYVVFPVADSFVIFLFLYGSYYLEKKNFHLSFFIFSLAVITHKAIWPFIFLIYLIYLLKNIKLNFNKWLYSSLILIIPILVYYLNGLNYYESIFWIVSKNIEVEVNSISSLFIFEGILNEIIYGKPQEILKGFLAANLFLFCLLLLYLSYKEKVDIYDYLVLPYVLPFIIYLAFLNHHEVFAAIRFSKLLIIPIIKICELIICRLIKNHSLKIYFFITTLFLSQFLMIHYFRIFFN